MDRRGEVRSWVLHRRAFREGTFILDLLCEELGRISAVWRRPKRGFKAEPFTLFSGKLSGNGELKTITKTESLSRSIPISGNHLYSALYVNELTHKCLPMADVSTEFFTAYRDALLALSAEQPESITLRKFERALFIELGIWPNLADALRESADKYFEVSVSEGVVAKSSLTSVAFTREDLQDIMINIDHRATRKMHRILVAQLTQGQVLHSRKLYQAAMEH